MENINSVQAEMNRRAEAVIERIAFDLRRQWVGHGVPGVWSALDSTIKMTIEGVEKPVSIVQAFDSGHIVHLLKEKLMQSEVEKQTALFFKEIGSMKKELEDLKKRIPENDPF